MNKFQLVVIAIILGLVTVAMLIFAGVIPGLGTSGGQNVAYLTMWGDLPAADIMPLINKLNTDNREAFNLTYVEKKTAVYEQDLLNALASGSGPDIWLLTQDLILKHRKKAYFIPFTVFAERSFKDMFIDEAELFLWKQEAEQGIIAVPFAIDPIVLYWNRDLFNKAGLTTPPRFWDDFLSMSQRMTERDIDGRILQSGAALGEFYNIKNAKDVFSMLVLQSGNKIVDPGSLALTFGKQGSLLVEPVGNALDFFVSFSNPAKISYSWNRALPEAQEYFSLGKLAMFLGYAGSYNAIAEKNPHLNFDVALAPNIKDSPVQTTFGRMYALAVSKSSSKASASIGAVFKVAEAGAFLVPVTRQLLGQGSSDPVKAVFYKAALQSSAWFEPEPVRVSEIFKEMTDALVTGKKRLTNAVADARTLLDMELKKVLDKK